MKTLAFLAIAVLLAGCVQEQQATRNVEVLFCPEDNCSEKLIEKFRNAGQSIDIAVYSFTLDEISSALIEAKNRGVRVRVAMDSLQASNRFSEDERLEGAGIPVKRIEKEKGIMHNKFAVIDNSLVATGSFNYSENANENNDENLVFLYGAEIAGEFAGEFEEIWQAG